MEKISVKAARQPAAIGHQVLVQGWIRTRRDSKGGFSFIELNDGSSLKSIQIIANAALPDYAQIEKVTTGASLRVTGKLVPSRMWYVLQ